MKLLAETQGTRQYFRQPVEEQGWLWFLPQLRSPYKIDIESASCNISHISSKMKTSTFFQVFKMRKPWLWLLELPQLQQPSFFAASSEPNSLWPFEIEKRLSGQFWSLNQRNLWPFIYLSKISKQISSTNHLDPLNDHPPAPSYLFKFILVRNTQFRMLVGYDR